MTLRTPRRAITSRAIAAFAIALFAAIALTAVQSAQANAATSYTEVTSGDYYSCGLTTTGNIECWGANESGQLGDGTTTDRLAPTDALVGTATAVDAGSNSACAIVSGAAVCWGAGYNGQLGRGNDTPNVGAPKVVSGLTSGVTSISVGQVTACAVQNGAAKCWGYGYLGDGSNF